MSDNAPPPLPPHPPSDGSTSITSGREREECPSSDLDPFLNCAKRIAVAVSGGIDSLVCAWLLRKKYPDLIGIHFTTGYEPAPLDIQHLENQLEMPVHCVDFSEVFERDVVQYFIKTYQNGKTPNPCLICNRQIKFGALIEAAKTLGADRLATGHYAEVRWAFDVIRESAITDLPLMIETSPPIPLSINGEGALSCGKLSAAESLTGRDTDAGTGTNGIPMLMKGKDPLKDQSYFLSRLTREQLSFALFPLAQFSKDEVIALAKQEGLVPCEKKESQDICFIHGNAFADFVASKCDARFPPGDIVTPDGTVVGTHRGLHRYTVGQRRGLNCPGPAPYYVKTIDMKRNRLVVAFKEALHESELEVTHLNWLIPESHLSQIPQKVMTKIRYSHAGAPSKLIPTGMSASNNGNENPGSWKQVTVRFDTPQLAVTPGQGAVFYDDNRVLGSGIII